MEKKILIFDTNAARQLSGLIRDKDIHFVVEKLLSKDILIYLSPIVMMELLSHIEGEKDRDYMASYHAIQALVLLWEAYPKEYRQVADPLDIIISENIFGCSIEPRKLMYNDFIGSAREIAYQDIGRVEDVLTADGETLKEFQDKMRNSFVEHFRYVEQNFLENHETKDAKDNFELEQAVLYGTYLGMTYELMSKYCGGFPNINAKLEEAKKTDNIVDRNRLLFNIKRDCNQIFKHIPSLYAIISILKDRDISSNMNMNTDKIANYLQDIYLSAHINQEHREGHAVLVTDDKALHLASEKANVPLAVMDCDSFAKLLD